MQLQLQIPVFNDQELVLLTLDAGSHSDLIAVPHCVEFEELRFCEEPLVDQRLWDQFLVETL